MKEAKHRIFGAKTVKTKRKYKERVSELRIEIANLLEESGAVGNVEAKQLAAWDMFDQNATSSFYDSEWMFNVNKGFDIVIGNPPYGYIFKQASYLPLLLDKYFVAEYKVEAYSIFTERGHDLLCKDGVLCFIMPYTFISGVYFSKFRHYLKRVGLNELVILGKKIFEAAEVDTTIMLINRGRIKPNIVVADLRDNDIKYRFDKLDYIDIPRNKFFALPNEVLMVSEEKKIDLYLKLMSKASDRMSDVIRFYHGIQTRGNKSALSQIKENKNYLPIIKGADFNRYHLDFGNIYMNFIPSNIKSGGDLSFYNVSEKLVVRTTADKIVATIDTNQYLTLNSVNVGVLISPRYNLYYILSIMNSKLMEFWYTLTVQEKNKTFAEVKIVYMDRIPLIEIDETTMSSFVDLCKTRLIEEDNIAVHIELQINLLVYHLYGLTYDEVLIVDPNPPFTREEYESA